MKKPTDMTPEELEKYLRQKMPKDIYEAHAHSTKNRLEVETSKKCGCFYCLYVFAPDSVWEWIKTNSEEFAMCPHCGIDAVLGDASGYPITKRFLQEMNKYWFDGKAVTVD